MAAKAPASAVVLVVMAVIGLFVGLGVGGAGCTQYRQAVRTKPEPQSMTLAELAKDGFGDNAHVVLTDFELLLDETVYETEGLSTTWEKVWIPMVPAGLDEQPSSISVLLESTDVKGEQGLVALAEVEKIQGVVDVLYGLGSEERELFEESFPEANLDDCLVVTQVELGHRELPATFWLVLMVVGFSILFVSLCILAYGFFFIRPRMLAAQAPRPGRRFRRLIRPAPRRRGRALPLHPDRPPARRLPVRVFRRLLPEVRRRRGRIHRRSRRSRRARPKRGQALCNLHGLQCRISWARTKRATGRSWGRWW